MAIPGGSRDLRDAVEALRLVSRLPRYHHVREALANWTA